MRVSFFGLVFGDPVTWLTDDYEDIQPFGHFHYTESRESSNAIPFAKTGRKKTLLVTRSKTKHSKVKSLLKNQGHDVTVTDLQNEVVLDTLGSLKFDNVLIFADRLEVFHPNDRVSPRKPHEYQSVQDYAQESAHEILIQTHVSRHSLVDAFDRGSLNILAVTGSEMGEISPAVSKLVSDFDVEFSPGLIVNHFETHKEDESFGNLLNFAHDESLLFPSLKNHNVTYRGLEHSTKKENPNLITGLHSPAGEKLVSVLQGRLNNRFASLGSLEMCSDRFFSKVCEDLILWVTQDRLVLRTRTVKHHKVNETQPPHLYDVQEEIIFSMQILEYKNKVWQPFLNATDLQVEFVRLDPFIRVYMPLVDNKGTYEVKIRTPADNGVFKFLVHHQRPFLTTLHVEAEAAVRPKRHDQFERFMRVAFPYYIGSIAMILLTVVFTILFVSFSLSTISVY